MALERFWILEWSICHLIMKSQCVKQACRDYRRKPWMIMVPENIQLRKKASDFFSSESEDEYKVFFIKSSRSSWTKLKRALQYNIISHDSIGIHHFPCIALVYAVFQIYFIDIICDKGNNVWSFILLAYWDKNTKKYFLLNVGLVAPKMQVTLNHEYLEPEVWTHTKLSLIWKG